MTVTVVDLVEMNDLARHYIQSKINEHYKRMESDETYAEENDFEFVWFEEFLGC